MKTPINRRTVLQAISAAPIVALPGVAVSASLERTEIQRLFAIWTVQRDNYVTGLKGSSKAAEDAKAAGRSDYLAVESAYNDKHAEPWSDKLFATEKVITAIPATNFVDIALKFKVANWPEDMMEPVNVSVMADMNAVLERWQKGVA